MLLGMRAASFHNIPGIQDKTHNPAESMYWKHLAEVALEPIAWQKPANFSKYCEVEAHELRVAAGIGK